MNSYLDSSSHNIEWKTVSIENPITNRISIREFEQVLIDKPTWKHRLYSFPAGIAVYVGDRKRKLITLEGVKLFIVMIGLAFLRSLIDNCPNAKSLVFINLSGKCKVN